MKSWTKSIRDDSIPLICLRWLEKTKNITHMMVKNGDLPWYKVNSSLETNANTLLGGMTGPLQIPTRMSMELSK